jgi:hypothetical protein
MNEMPRPQSHCRFAVIVGLLGEHCARMMLDLNTLYNNRRSLSGGAENERVRPTCFSRLEYETRLDRV